MVHLARSALTIVSAAIVVSCASVTPDLRPATQEPNPRIEYRDLSAATPVVRNSTGELRADTATDAPGMGDTRRPGAMGTRPPDPQTLPVFIDFANESATLDLTRVDFSALKTAEAKGRHFFVIGQSHGQSSVGVHTLAVKRAQAVARALANEGLDPTHIHTLASWSTAREAFAPSRGVQVLVLDLSSDPSAALLALQGS